MLVLKTNEPNGSLGYIQIGEKAAVNDNIITLAGVEGIIDKSITVAGLRALYFEAKTTGLPLFIDKDLGFHGKLKECAEAFVSKPETFTIYTRNTILLNALNNALNKDLKPEKVLVVDSYNFYHKNYHALPKMYDSKGIPTTLLKALSSLLKYIISRDYTHVVFATESSSSLRISKTKELYGDNCYKAGRKETELELKQQIKLCESFLSKIGYIPLSFEGYEADDSIASVVHEFQTRYPGVPVHCITGDKDMNQLFTYPDFRLVEPKTKELFDRTHVMDKFGVPAEQFLDYQAIVGDTIDNVKGIPGVGAKGAIELLEEFGSLDNIIANVDNIKSKARKEKMLNGGIESALVSKDLVTMRRHLLTDTDLSIFGKKQFDIESIIKDLLKEYQINY